MKTIPLTKGKLALVDDEDFERISQYKWHIVNVYAGYREWAKDKEGKWFTKKYHKMHRLILDAPEHLQVDHINGNALDNRKSNLRLVTNQQNCWNKTELPRNTSGFRGVSRHRANRWRAYIAYGGKQVSLGTYKDKEEAITARKNGERKYYGEYSPLAAHPSAT